MRSSARILNKLVRLLNNLSLLSEIVILFQTFADYPRILQHQLSGLHRMIVLQWSEGTVQFLKSELQTLLT
jgi:hypothetical protein